MRGQKVKILLWQLLGLCLYIVLMLKINQAVIFWGIEEYWLGFLLGFCTYSFISHIAA